MTIRLEDDLKRALEKIAEQTGLPETELIRICIRQQLKELSKTGKLSLKIKSQDLK